MVIPLGMNEDDVNEGRQQRGDRTRQGEINDGERLLCLCCRIATPC